MHVEPGFQDAEAFGDFCDALSDYAPRIEASVAALRRDPANPAALAELFRLVHTIKGDAGLCRVEFVVPLLHALETALGRLRAGELQFTERLASVLLLALDRLELSIDALQQGAPTRALRLDALQQGLEALAELPPAAFDMACQRLVDVMTGQTDLDSNVPSSRARRDDLAFFRTLAQQLEARSPLFAGRTERNLRLALDINELAGGWINREQLEAAVYLHDVGMMFLPEALWLNNTSFNEDQRRQMAEHANWGYQLLLRMSGWEEAAVMVYQHHERHDGSGYPQRLTSSQIVPGAKVLALVDAFEAVMLRHAHRGQQLSLLRAAAEVNASDYHFDPQWVEPFNRAVRLQLEREGEGSA